MQTYVIGVHDRALRLESNDQTLVRTSRGVDEITVRIYSAEWLEGFDLSCAMKGGDTLVEQALELAETPDADWLAEATVPVPNSVLEEDGPLAVTVHGVRGTDHIITERAFPLTVAHEGDGIGATPRPNPR